MANEGYIESIRKELEPVFEDFLLHAGVNLDQEAEVFKESLFEAFVTGYLVRIMHEEFLNDIKKHQRRGVPRKSF